MLASRVEAGVSLSGPLGRIPDMPADVRVRDRSAWRTTGCLPSWRCSLRSSWVPPTSSKHGPLWERSLSSSEWQNLYFPCRLAQSWVCWYRGTVRLASARPTPYPTVMPGVMQYWSFWIMPRYPRVVFPWYMGSLDLVFGTSLRFRYKYCRLLSECHSICVRMHQYNHRGLGGASPSAWLAPCPKKRFRAMVCMRSRYLLCNPSSASRRVSRTGRSSRNS
mmetsp:Transcript_3404/g.9533  ORF Transcript_3404/g.9533 Transcript_3404/m.9533 type:complete len:220 (-) Transcript_3404:943-1602(-)